MNEKGQGAIEYLLVLGGAVLIAAILISLITSQSSTSENQYREAQGEFEGGLDRLANRTQF